MWPLLAGYVLVAGLLALVTGVAAQARFSLVTVVYAAAPGWLAAHQVPVYVNGEPLGVLPLVPTIGLCLLVARAAAGAARRLGYREPAQAVPLIGILTVAHATLGTTIAILSAGSPVTVEPLDAFLVPALLAAVSATAGVSGRCGLLGTVRRYLDPVAMRGLRTGAMGLAALLGVGGLVYLLALALSVPTSLELYRTGAPDVGSAVGMFLLSAGYLPNAMVAGLSFAAGPGLSLGAVDIGMFGFSGGEVPSLPLLAVLPEQPAQWWPVLLLLPAGVGVLVGWQLRRVSPDPLLRLRAVGVAGALTAFGCVVLGTVAGGRLGSGLFDPVEIPVAALSVSVFCWVVLPAALVVWVVGGTPEPEAPVAVDDTPTEQIDAVPAEPEEVPEAEPGEAAAEEEPGETPDPEEAEETEETVVAEDAPEEPPAEEPEEDPEQPPAS
ncbi:hypothetical protein EWH70_18190 [Amycolatopsis suaedae]|uniref:Uncharacterized protein n=1 Tax=Amycolatopsis suaedae TaxID=2510978 RepID=A0A4Q7J7G0_9PSEU|nr:hypothetical protein EWH70_18190 [Amycolatopsis suaedae]